MSANARGLIENPATLTPKQEKTMEETRACLLFNYPGFTHIWYSLLDKAGRPGACLFVTNEHNVCPVAATDGTCIIINVDTFFGFPLKQRVFILAHEIAHCMFNHPIEGYHLRKAGHITYEDGTTLPYDHVLTNESQDYVINGMQVTVGVGEMPKKDDGSNYGLHDPAISDGRQPWKDVYRKLYEQNGGGGGGNCPVGPPGGGFDVILDPGTADGKDPTTASKDRNKAQWKQEMEAARQITKAQGKDAGALETMFGDALAHKVNWSEHIKALLARKLGTEGLDWTKPDRRYAQMDAFYPSASGFGTECVVVGVDSSGSIYASPKTLDMFLAEVAGILEEVNPKHLHLVWCDAEVHRVDELDDPNDLNTVRAKGSVGGGGTSFEPVFDWIEKNDVDPDALVYLTDGYGTFPSRVPNFPVIWGSITDASYPFGDVVKVPVQAER